MSDQPKTAARLAAMLEDGVAPPPAARAGATGDVDELIVAYCLDDATAGERARVVRAMAADPDVLDQVIATRRALRAAGVLPQPDDARETEGSQGAGDAIVGQPEDAPASPLARAPLAVVRAEPAPATHATGSGPRTARRHARMTWLAAAGVLAAAAVAFLTVRRPAARDASTAPATNATGGVTVSSAPQPSPAGPAQASPRAPTAAPNVAQAGPQAAAPRVAAPPFGAPSPVALPPGALTPVAPSPGAPPPAPAPPRDAPIGAPRVSVAFALADLGGRDSVEVRLGADAGQGADALTRHVVAALPADLAADTSLRVAIVSETPAGTRSADKRPTTSVGGSAARLVRIVIRSTGGPCVGPEARVVTQQTDLRTLLARSAAEYRRCAGPQE